MRGHRDPAEAVLRGVARSLVQQDIGDRPDLRGLLTGEHQPWRPAPTVVEHVLGCALVEDDPFCRDTHSWPPWEMRTDDLGPPAQMVCGWRKDVLGDAGQLVGTIPDTLAGNLRPTVPATGNVLVGRRACRWRRW